MMTRLRRRAATPPAGLPLPDAVDVEPRRVRVAGTLQAPLAVVGYPREVRHGWLEPLVNYPGAADVALHIEPIPPAVAVHRLRRQLARLESTRRIDAAKGRLPDPIVDVAAEDAHDLADRLARGEGRLFSLGLYAAARGRDDADLARDTGRLRALLGSLLLDPVPTTYRSLAGWLSCLPLGLDLLGMRRTVDTAALAASFPFASAELSEPGGVLYGTNTRTSGLVFWDRFAQPNYNTAILARSGAGKSYLAKLELLRSLYTGVEAHVVDPENEYARLAELAGGVCLPLGQPGVRVNPFDLDRGEEALVRRALFLHTLVGLLLAAPLTATQRTVLDRAILAAYEAKGITADPRTHRRPVPMLADLAAALAADADPAGRQLADRLTPFTRGAHRMLFDGPTSTVPDGHLVVFALREVPDELKPAATLLALDVIWRRVADPAQRRRRLVLVDEAWLLMRDREGARFLFKLAKSARKHWCGLTYVTQDAADLLATDLGQAVVSNAATQILLRQAPQAMPALAEAFRLSDGEQQFLLGAPRGHALLLGGGERVTFAARASTVEHAAITTDPAELDDEDAA